MGKGLNKSYKCLCGEEHEFSAYVFAHTRDELVHACDKCGRKNTILHLELVDSEDPAKALEE